MFSVYLIAAFFAVVYGGSLTAIPEVAEFIKKTGGHQCVAYSSIWIYAALDIGQLIFGAMAIFVLWWLNRRGRCGLSRVVFFFVVLEVLAEIILRQGCAQ